MTVYEFGLRIENKKFESSRSVFEKERERGMADLLSSDNKSYQQRTNPDDISRDVEARIVGVRRERREYANQMRVALIVIIVSSVISVGLLALTLLFGCKYAYIVAGGFIGVVITNVYKILSKREYARSMGATYYYMGEAEGIKSEIMDWKPDSNLPT